VTYADERLQDDYNHGRNALQYQERFEQLQRQGARYEAVKAEFEQQWAAEDEAYAAADAAGVSAPVDPIANLVAERYDEAEGAA
jgi:crotonobetainyl-CoA:carnitine CoA-transferase CaiB-like acyl-CoA transferase